MIVGLPQRVPVIYIDITAREVEGREYFSLPAAVIEKGEEFNIII